MQELTLEEIELVDGGFYPALLVGAVLLFYVGDAW